MKVNGESGKTNRCEFEIPTKESQEVPAQKSKHRDEELDKIPTKEVSDPGKIADVAL